MAVLEKHYDQFVLEFIPENLSKAAFLVVETNITHGQRERLRPMLPRTHLGGCVETCVISCQIRHSDVVHFVQVLYYDAIFHLLSYILG